MSELEAPFPYFGGKSMIAEKVWDALGQPKHYIEPFFGSGAVLLARPNFDPTVYTETVCDKDGFIANIWRALQSDPDAVAKVCDNPVNHADLSARKLSLIANTKRLLENLGKDPKWYDVEMAGYWIWAASCWIASGLTYIGQIPHIGKTGMGVHKLSGIPYAGDEEKDVREPYNTNIYKWFRQLSERLRYVRVVCGDWTRVCGGNWQDKIGDVGLFFDPPYGVEDRDTNIYQEDSAAVAKEVEKWCLERGKIKTYRIVVAGYDTEYQSLLENGWTYESWKTGGGYSKISTSQNETQGKLNRHRERLFFSPFCIKNTLF